MAKRLLAHLGLFTASAVLFSLSFPSIIHDTGLPFIAFFAMIPFFIAVNRIRWWSAPLWGLYTGFITYALFNYWLINFHPLAIFIVPVIYAVYYMLLFPVLRLMRSAFPRWGWLAQAAVWMAYEYLRTLGFLGYSYGIIGYSQYQWSSLVRISAVGGVWAVSLYVILPSILAAWIIAGLLESGTRIELSRILDAVRAHRVCLVLIAVFAVLLPVGGSLLAVDTSGSPKVRMALVQQNVDPWIGGVSAYRRSLDILLRESASAVQSDPDLDMIVWSETSFVPSIDFHRRNRSDVETYELVRRLTAFQNEVDLPFVIGNGDRQLRRNQAGQLETYDYNAVLLMQKGQILDTYRKTHLVPFTEHFPYQRQFPWLYQLLVENDTTFWAHGSEYTVFEAAGIRFSSPICFEDTFGYLNREFVRDGAEVLVNLTNDSWAHSVASAMQHMAMAVFRAAETRRSMVRSTNGGITTLIDPNGRIVDTLPAFVEGHLIVDVPVYTSSDTVYTAYGDWLAYVFVITAAVLLVIAAVIKILQLTETLKQGHNV